MDTVEAAESLKEVKQAALGLNLDALRLKAVEAESKKSEAFSCELSARTAKDKTVNEGDSQIQGQKATEAVKHARVARKRADEAKVLANKIRQEHLKFDQKVECARQAVQFFDGESKRENELNQRIKLYGTKLQEATDEQERLNKEILVVGSNIEEATKKLNSVSEEARKAETALELQRQEAFKRWLELAQLKAQAAEDDTDVVPMTSCKLAPKKEVNPKLQQATEEFDKAAKLIEELERIAREKQMLLENARSDHGPLSRKKQDLAHKLSNAMVRLEQAQSLKPKEDVEAINLQAEKATKADEALKAARESIDEAKKIAKALKKINDDATKSAELAKVSAEGAEHAKNLAVNARVQTLKFEGHGIDRHDRQGGGLTEFKVGCRSRYGIDPVNNSIADSDFPDDLHRSADTSSMVEYSDDYVIAESAMRNTGLLAPTKPLQDLWGDDHSSKASGRVVHSNTPTVPTTLNGGPATVIPLTGGNVHGPNEGAPNPTDYDTAAMTTAISNNTIPGDFKGGEMIAVYRDAGGSRKLTTMYPNPVIHNRVNARLVPSITNEKVLTKGKTGTAYVAVPLVVRLGLGLTFTTAIEQDLAAESGLKFDLGTNKVVSRSATKKEGTYNFKLKVTDDADTVADEILAPDSFSSTVNATVDPVVVNIPDQAVVTVVDDFAQVSGLKFDTISCKVVDRVGEPKTSGTYDATIKVQTSKEETSDVTVSTTVHAAVTEEAIATFDPAAEVIDDKATVTVVQGFPIESGLAYDTVTRTIVARLEGKLEPGKYTCKLQVEETKITETQQTVQAVVKTTFTEKTVTDEELKQVKIFKLTEAVPLDPASGLYVDLANYAIKERPGAFKTPGTYRFQLMLKGRQDRASYKWLEVTIDPDPKFEPEAVLPTPKIGVPYQQQVPKKGGLPNEKEPADILFQLTGVAPGGTPPVVKDPQKLPPGLNYCCGKLTGVPEQAGTFEFEVEVEDADGKKYTKPFKLVIDPLIPLSITTVERLAEGRVGESYAQLFATKDGSGLIKSWTATPEPGGLRMGKTGILGGIPSEPGEIQIAMAATDSAGGTDSKTYLLRIAAAPFRITSPVKLLDGKTGATYKQPLEAEGGHKEYGEFVIDSGLPPGIALTGGNKLTGQPSKPGTYWFTGKVQDKKGNLASKDFEITIAASPLSVDSLEPIEEAHLGEEFQTAFAGKGGWPELGPLEIEGLKPKGLTFADGVLSGVPEESGEFDLAVIATDAHLATARKEFKLIVNPQQVEITTERPLTAGTVNEAYVGDDFATDHGWGKTRTFSIESESNTTTSGSAKSGLAISGAKLQGTPSGWGDFLFKIAAKDERGKKSEPKEFALTIEPPPVKITKPLDNASLEARVGATVNYKITTADGWRPVARIDTEAKRGLAVVKEGEEFFLKGEPDQYGDHPFTFVAYDAKNKPSEPRSLIVKVAAELPEFDGSLEFEGTAKTDFAHEILARKGWGTLLLTHSSGKLPDGVKFDNGKLSGTPAKGGDFTFQVTCKDEKGKSKSASVRLKIAHPPVVLVVGECRVPDGRVGDSYAAEFVCTGGNGTGYAVNINGALPKDVKLNGRKLSGTPSESGDFTITVTGKDGAGNLSASQQFPLSILKPITITTAGELGSVTMGEKFTKVFTAEHGRQEVKQFVIVGEEPKKTGLAFEVASLTGIASEYGEYTINVKAVDQDDRESKVVSCTLLVNPHPPSVTTVTLPSGTVKTAYNQPLLSKDGWGKRTLSMKPAVDGFALDGDSLKGRSDEPLETAISIIATDEKGTSSAAQELRLVIEPEALAIVTTALPNANQNEAYTAQIQVTGGWPTVTIELVGDDNPAGLTCSGTTLSGPLKNSEKATVTVRAKDNKGNYTAPATLPLQVYYWWLYSWYRPKEK